MSSAGGDVWAGWHGVHVRSSPFPVGSLSGMPIAEAIVRVDALPPPEGPELWRIHGEVETVDGTLSVDRWLRQRADGRYVVHASSGPEIAVDVESGEVTMEPGDDERSIQLVASFGLPLIVNGYQALVLHGSAFARDGEALVICGNPGSGKSSSLVRMVDAGWQALSEDVCVVDLRGDAALVWPGPPWVRRTRGEAGPVGARALFESPDKTAWDIGPRQPHGPVRVSRLVFLDPPGGNAPQWQGLSQPDAVQALGGHAAWLRDPADAAARLFVLALELTRRMPAARLRLPHDPDWLDGLPDVLVAGP